MAYQRVDLPSTPFGHAAYAHFLAHPSQDASRGLLLFSGGSIDEATYWARRDSRPESLESLVLELLRDREDTVVDLLVVPCPYGARDSWLDHLSGYRTMVIDGLLEMLTLRPERVALVGNSLGAFFNLSLVGWLVGAENIVSIAGVGLVEGCESLDLGDTLRSAVCLSNQDDFARPHSERFIAWLEGRGIPCHLVTGAGTHSFSDYEANGLAKQAFEHALTLLSG